MTVEPAVLTVAGLALSGLRIEPRRAPAVATILALPGGGYSSGYWHHPLCPEASLLTMGAVLGYRVIALDRPGYRLSARPGDEGMLLDDQASVVAEIVATLNAEDGAGAGVFLVGHSMGGIIALMAASLRRAPRLLGLDVSGVPRRFSDDLATAVALELDPESDGRPPADLSAARLFYGPTGTFEGRLLVGGDVSAEPLPMTELRDSFAWPDRFVEVAAAIDAPVQFTLGEFERTSRADPGSLADIAALFPASPRVITWLQSGAGHNISLHHVARAYHLRAFAFFDEVLAQGRR